MTSRDPLFTRGKRNSAEKKQTHSWKLLSELPRKNEAEILQDFEKFHGQKECKGRAVHQHHFGVKTCRKESLKSIFWCM